MGKKKKENKIKSFGKEFKEFITKGNVINLAIGVIIGGAFQSVINSAVNDVLMPLIGIFTKDVDFSQAFLDLSLLRDPELTAYATAELAQAQGHVVLSYGTLITAVINFLIIGFVVFLIVKSISSVEGVSKKARRKRRPEPEAPKPEPTTKQCPFCCSEIAVKAVRCPLCTSVLEEKLEA